MKGELAKAFRISGAVMIGGLMLYTLRLAIWSWAIIAAVLERGGM